MSTIEIYDNLLTAEECDRCIEIFEGSPQSERGDYGNTNVSYDVNTKSSLQVNVNLTEDTELNRIVLPKLGSALNDYYDKNPALKKVGPTILTAGAAYQKFEDENDGFKEWHTEHNPYYPFNLRVLAWMIYMNDASGTEFYSFDTVEAKQGRCVIWPASWEYLHRSEKNRGLKYIISGWCSFQLKDEEHQKIVNYLRS